MPIYSGQIKTKLYIGSVKVKKAYLGATKVYSSGNIVTYKVDTNTTYTEEVDEGASCLSPNTFVPTKSGWEFVGWRVDSTANGTVLSSKVMGDDPITLYAVFRASVTVTYYNNSTAASTTSGYRYYNNGNVVNPSFTLTQAVKSGWTARGWSTSNSGSAAVSYNNGVAFTRSSNITLYGLYYQTITVTYYNASATAATTSGYRYWAPAGAINPSFTLTQAALSGWTPRGWSASNAGNAAISYNNGVAFTRSSNITLYGLYYQTITLTTVANGVTSAQNGYRYWAPAGAIDPYFTVANPSKSGATFLGWSSDGSTNISNATISGLYLSVSTTRYAVFKYNDATVAGFNATLSTTNTTVYTLDTSKYASCTFTAYTYNGMSWSNPTTGFAAVVEYVGGTGVRSYVGYSGNTPVEQSGTVGYGGNAAQGKQFTLTVAGNITAYYTNSNTYIYAGSITLYVLSITLNGKTVVG